VSEERSTNLKWGCDPPQYAHDLAKLESSLNFPIGPKVEFKIYDGLNIDYRTRLLIIRMWCIQEVRFIFTIYHTVVGS